LVYFRRLHDILDNSEKRGRATRPQWLINGFRQAILDSGLSHGPVEGYPFTWFKSLGTPRVVEERLDRALANNSWLNQFSNALLENLVAPVSNHYPLLLHRCYVSRPHAPPRKFRYENMWQLEPGFMEIVTDSWNLHLTDSITPKLFACADDISVWSNTHCRKLKSNIEDCHRKLKLLRGNNAGMMQAGLLELR
jgi:hypothetical protein